MNDVARRNRANKRAGAQWEADLIAYFRVNGDPAEGLRKAGRDDEGDIGVQPTGGTPDHLVFEAKNEKTWDIAGYVRQAETEAANYAKRRGLDPEHVSWAAVVKRRGHGAGKAYVITTLEHYMGYDIEEGE